MRGYWFLERYLDVEVVSHKCGGWFLPDWPDLTLDKQFMRLLLAISVLDQ